MSFRTRITLLTAALVFTVTTVTLVSVLKLADQVLRRELGGQLLTLATTTALLVDGDQHATLTRPEQMSDPAYRSTKALLIRLQRATADRHVKYLYTMARTDTPGIYRFVVDSDEGPDAAKLGDEYDARPFPELLAAFNGPVAESEYRADQWGPALSAYAPIYDRAGLPVAIVGVDAEPAALEHMRRGVVARLAVSLLVGLVLAFGAGMYSGRILARPLDELVTATDRFSRGDYDRRVAIATPPEFARVGEALNRMLLGLRERDLIRSTFERYMSRPVAERILSDPGGAALAGEHRTVTVAFARLRGAQWHSTALTPEEMLGLLNTYFARMIDVVFAHEGTLDKFVGDGMLCLFGAPLEKPEDPDRAIRAAVALQREVAWINAGRRAAGQTELRLAVGVHTGPVVSGQIGAERRLEYGVVGDAVNLATRVEEEAAAGEVLLTQATWELVKERVACIEREPRVLKGWDEPMTLFELLGLRAKSDAAEPERVLRLRPGPMLGARCLGSDGEAGRVVDLRADGAVVLADVPLPPRGVRIEVELPDGGGSLGLAAQRASTDEIEPVAPGLRFLHHLRFASVAEAERDRLLRALWRASVAPGDAGVPRE